MGVFHRQCGTIRNAQAAGACFLITLRPIASACYVAQLKPLTQVAQTIQQLFDNVLGPKCYELSWACIAAFLLFPGSLSAQRVTRMPARPGAPQPGWVHVSADSQDSQNHVYKLRGHAKVETVDSILEADEVDYNDETGDAKARGHVRYHNFVGGE